MSHIFSVQAARWPCVACADLQDVDEEEAAAQRRAERRRREEDQVDDLDDDDEFADFLVDDDEGDKPDGEPRRRRRQALARALPAGVSADAFQVHALHWRLQHSCWMSALSFLLWSSRARQAYSRSVRMHRC